MKFEFEIVQDNNTYYDHWYGDCLEDAFETVIKWWFGSEVLENLEYSKDMTSVNVNDNEGIALFAWDSRDIRDVKVFKNKSITWAEFRGLN